MLSLPPEKKRQVIEQVRGKFDKATSSGPQSSAMYGPSSESALVPRLVPQFSGDTSVNSKSCSGGNFASSPRSSFSPEKPVEDVQTVKPQTTGSMFSTWWAALGGKVATNNEHATSARAYVDSVHELRNVDSNLVKHLIPLQMHISTAKSGLLSSLVGKGGERRALTDSASSVLLEVIRAFRVLLNTEPGFDAVLLLPTIITHIGYSLHGMLLKIWTLAAELLAAIWMVSFDEGHRAVMAALSEYRIAYNELFRFQSLVSVLMTSDSAESAMSEVTFPMEEEGSGKLGQYSWGSSMP
ncbi:armadillo-type protein [Chiua virens]|nr:armadillo-type protein [Chiua virens]